MVNDMISIYIWVQKSSHFTISIDFFNDYKFLENYWSL